MKFQLLLLFGLFLFASCEEKSPGNKVVTQQVKKQLTDERKLKLHLDGIKNFSDTVFLGFTLRSSKSETLAHIKSLMKQGKTKSIVAYNISLLGSSVVIGGYPYTLYIEGKKMETVFKPFYENNKLYQIEVAMIEGGDSDYVVRAMNKKYGRGKEVVKDSNRSYKWIKNNTEIEVGTGGLFTITYTDLAKSEELAKLTEMKKNEQLKKGTAETKEAL